MADEEKDKPDLRNKVVKLEQELLRVNPQIFQGMSPKKREELVKSVISIKFRSSPFPPFEELQEYEKLHPGCSKLIFEAFENQSAHRLKIEDKVITSQQNQSKTGQFMAFATALAVLGVAGWLTINNHDTVGGILGGFDIVGLATVFIIGNRQQSENLQAKNPDNKSVKGN